MNTPSYKTLYLDLQERYIRLSTIATRLMDLHLADMEAKEKEAAETSDRLQNVMTQMATKLQEKIKNDKAKKAGTPSAK